MPWLSSVLTLVIYISQVNSEELEHFLSFSLDYFAFFTSSSNFSHYFLRPLDNKQQTFVVALFGAESIDENVVN